MIYRIVLVILLTTAQIKTVYSDEETHSYIKSFAALISLNLNGFRMEVSDDITGPLIENLNPNKRDTLDVHSFRIHNPSLGNVYLFFSLSSRSKNSPYHVHLNIGLEEGYSQNPVQNGLDFLNQPTITKVASGIYKAANSIGLPILKKHHNRVQAPLVYFPRRGKKGLVSVPQLLSSSFRADEISSLIEALAEHDFTNKPSQTFSRNNEHKKIFLSSDVINEVRDARNDHTAAHLKKDTVESYLFFQDLIKHNPLLSKLFPDERMQFQLAEDLSADILNEHVKPIEDVIIDFEERMLNEHRLEFSKLEHLAKEFIAGNRSSTVFHFNSISCRALLN